jgi:hypothetical protein
MLHDLMSEGVAGNDGQKGRPRSQPRQVLGDVASDSANADPHAPGVRGSRVHRPRDVSLDVQARCTDHHNLGLPGFHALS